GRFTWALPSGMRALSPYTVGHDGSFARVLRDDHAAAAYVSADGASWSPIGKTMGQGESATIQDYAGTFLVDAQGTNDFFVPTPQWPDAPGGQIPELLQSSVQLVRPATGVAAVINPRWYPVALSSDGQRAAYWEEAPSDTRLVIHDLVRDIRT